MFQFHSTMLYYSALHIQSIFFLPPFQSEILTFSKFTTSQFSKNMSTRHQRMLADVEAFKKSFADHANIKNIVFEGESLSFQLFGGKKKEEKVMLHLGTDYPGNYKSIIVPFVF